MRKAEVIKKIGGKGNWPEFEDYMQGQTVGIYPDGSFNFYESDVKEFVEAKKAGRQPRVWD